MNTNSGDTSVLTVITGSIAVVLFLLLIGAWWKIRSLVYNKKALLAKITEIEKHNADATRQLAETRAQQNAEIQRQKDEIERLHAVLAGKPNVPGGGSAG